MAVGVSAAVGVGATVGAGAVGGAGGIVAVLVGADIAGTVVACGAVGVAFGEGTSPGMAQPARSETAISTMSARRRIINSPFNVHQPIV